MKTQQIRVLNIMALPMLILVGLASYQGIFNPGVYERETLSMAVQGVGQDIINLFVGIPVMLIAMFFMNKGKRSASIIFAGMDFYYMYSYIIYTFGIRHNNLFLAYCFILALSAYILIFWINWNMASEVDKWYKKNPPIKLMAYFLVFIAIMFYFLWLSDIIPALLKGEAPAFVVENGYLVNAVHAIDLSFALPGMIVISILLFRKHKAGLILAPIVNSFVLILTIALISMAVMLKKEGVSEDLSVVFVFIFLALISSIMLYLFLSKLKKE